MAVTLAFACNDTRNGHPLGKFCQLQVDCGDISIRMVGPWEDEEGTEGVAIDFDFKVMGGEGTVTIADRTFKGYSWQSWYGNWCWDAVRFAWPEALAILNLVAKLPDWHCEEAPCALFDALELRSEITPEEWRAELAA